MSILKKDLPTSLINSASLFTGSSGEQETFYEGKRLGQPAYQGKKLLIISLLKLQWVTLQR